MITFRPKLNPSPAIAPGETCLSMTLSASSGTAPLFNTTADGLVTATYERPDGTTITTNYSTGVFTMAGKYKIRFGAGVAATVDRWQFGNCNLTATSRNPHKFLPNLTRMDGWSNNNWIVNFNDWSGLAQMRRFAMGRTVAATYTNATANLTAWAIPSTFLYMSATYCNFTVDFTGSTLPSGVTYLDLNTMNTANPGRVSGAVGQWTLPSGLTLIDFRNTRVTGDITNWGKPTFPTSMTTFYTHTSGISGDVTDWRLNAAMLKFSILESPAPGDSVGLYGSIQGLMENWPNTFYQFEIYTCPNITGSVTNVRCPTALTAFLAHSTGLTGDISLFAPQSAMQQFTISDTAITGDMSQLYFPAITNKVECARTGVTYVNTGSGLSRIGDTPTGKIIDFTGCNLVQAQVDNILVDLAASGIKSSTIRLTGNAAPSATGLTAKTTLTTSPRSNTVLVAT